MTSAANGNQDIVFARESDASDYVGWPGTANNDRRPPVNHRIGDGSGSVIAMLAGAE
jgi:hypothetical protein